jgi:threonyl-tRNA synthetase
MRWAGDREAEAGEASVRIRSGEAPKSRPIVEVMERMRQEVEQRT